MDKRVPCPSAQACTEVPGSLNLCALATETFSERLFRGNFCWNPAVIFEQESNHHMFLILNMPGNSIVINIEMHFGPLVMPI